MGATIGREVNNLIKQMLPENGGSRPMDFDGKFSDQKRAS